MGNITLGKLEFKTIEEHEELERRVTGLTILEIAKGENETFYLRKRGDSTHIYKSEKPTLTGGVYRCDDCNGRVIEAIVAHPTKGKSAQGPSSLSLEWVPYCPRCEKEPNPNGEPITCKGRK